ncbi:hypothetical protein [Catelliglobosispora koreensis]|nr:hypothetical protein [Catelliglobosispora koreensis]
MMRELGMVCLVALIALIAGAAIVLAPWHPAEAAAVIELLPPR